MLVGRERSQQLWLAVEVSPHGLVDQPEAGFGQSDRDLASVIGDRGTLDESPLLESVDSMALRQLPPRPPTERDG